ncbi:MAG: DNRLRE domain-containing protein [Bacteroidia bacterium]
MKNCILILLTALPAFGWAQSSKIILNHTQCKDAAVDIYDNSIDNKNWGQLSETGIVAWTSSGLPLMMHTLIWFDLSVFTSQSKANISPAQIKNATLHLYTPENPGFVPQGNRGNNTFQVFRITSPWDENTVTWAKKPAYDNSVVTNVPDITIQYNTHFTANVTPQVKTMAANNNTNYGLYIKLLNEATYRSVAIASKEHPDVNLRPWLEIELYANSNTSATDLTGYMSNLLVYQNNQKAIQCSFIPEESGNVELSIMNASGQQVLSHTTMAEAGNTFETTLGTDKLAAGIYFVSITQNGRRHCTKIQVK